ncbi:NUDIX domain-containing protein [Natronoflexus pectinivorans]|uniref:8-oxo-dGTP diphosphatase n=1 Tax=Natronoflexus pectinivorans TaxID=682526 RepID=A0A4R2GJ98_9BACT|nr:NUDIX hydrolase [Natronoflexus pectinivorans]TCO08801.1 8-oxo-dGTP diphosphatase [Natronoflexus pectinivorans]
MYTYNYPRPSVTCDVVVFSVGKDQSKVLLIKRKFEPFKGLWALPGGFVDENEDLTDTALRELEEETGLSGVKVKQIGAYGKPNRDPRGHTITIAYLAVTKVEVELNAGDDAHDAAWFRTDELPELAFDHSVIIQDALNLL